MGCDQRDDDERTGATTGSRVGCSSLDKAIQTDPYCAADDGTHDGVVRRTGSIPAVRED